MVKPLALNGFQVTVVPLTEVIVTTTGTRLELTVPVPIAAQNVVVPQVSDAIVLMVTPLWVNEVHVVPGDAEPVFEKIVAPLEVVPLTKQIGCVEELGQTIWESPVVVGMVSLVQVTVDPEIVAVNRTPFDEVPAPMAMQAGVVALVGHTMEVSWETPEGSALFDHVVPLVDVAAAPPEELYPTAMHSVVVHAVPSTRVIVVGKVATDQPELVLATPVASGDTEGAVAGVAGV